MTDETEPEKTIEGGLSGPMTTEDIDPAFVGIDMAGGESVPGIPPGYMMNNQGHLIPENKVRDQIKLTDQTVRKIFEYADDLSGQIARFKSHTYDDLATLTDLLREKYGAEKGTGKGNMTFTSFDGTKKVVVAVSDYMDYGPELQVAKDLLDDFLADEAKTASDAIRAVINQVFSVEKPGQVNRQALFALRQIEVDDDRWRRAMEAIADGIRIAGSKTYIRVYERDSAEGRFRQVPLSLAAV